MDPELQGEGSREEGPRKDFAPGPSLAAGGPEEAEASAGSLCKAVQDPPALQETMGVQMIPRRCWAPPAAACDPPTGVILQEVNAQVETLRGLQLAWRAEAHMEGRPASDSRPGAWVQLWPGDVGDPLGQAAA